MQGSLASSSDPRCKPSARSGYRYKRKHQYESVGLPLMTRIRSRVSRGTLEVVQATEDVKHSAFSGSSPCKQAPAVTRRAMMEAALYYIGTGTLLTQRPAAAFFVDEEASTAVFIAAAPSVVSIENFTVVRNGAIQQESVGSGFVWDLFGHIVTNYHCVGKVLRDPRGETRVVLEPQEGDAMSFPARVIGTDPSRDLAVLSIDAPPEALRPARIGTSSDLVQGQFVYAIGSPGGLSRSQSCGIVSGLGRSIPSPTGLRIGGAIQTDAAITSELGVSNSLPRIAGNSGGPLLDSSGRVVGVNTATFTREGSGQSSGVNFALPIDLVLEIVPRLIIYGQASSKRI